MPRAACDPAGGGGVARRQCSAAGGHRRALFLKIRAPKAPILCLCSRPPSNPLEKQHDRPGRRRKKEGQATEGASCCGWQSSRALTSPGGQRHVWQGHLIAD
jgi:hypothetical protein